MLELGGRLQVGISHEKPVGCEWGVGDGAHSTVTRNRYAQGICSMRQGIVGREGGHRVPGQ